jgi:hypothetical protein
MPIDFTKERRVKESMFSPRTDVPMAGMCAALPLRKMRRHRVYACFAGAGRLAAPKLPPHCRPVRRDEVGYNSGDQWAGGTGGRPNRQTA